MVRDVGECWVRIGGCLRVVGDDQGRSGVTGDDDHGSPWDARDGQESSRVAKEGRG